MEDISKFIQYLEKMGIEVSVDDNPSPEKLAEIRAKIESKKLIL